MDRTKDKTIDYINDFLNNDYLGLKDNLEKLLKDYEKKSKRLDRIIKQSDAQQLGLIKSHTLIHEQKDELDKLYSYDKEQQEIAKEKVESTIVDNLKDSSTLTSKVIYHPADILSGDFYSTHILKNGASFIYVIDGQGHGISPALTVFAISATISNLIKYDTSFELIIEKLFPMIQGFLGEIEQISYTMIYIDNSGEKISYVSGGMYPFLIKEDKNILKYKANNLPFMNFSQTPTISSFKVKNWSDLVVYTDGLVEDLNEDMSEYSPLNLLENQKLFNEVQDKINHIKFGDDITVMKILNPNHKISSTS